MSLRVKTLVIIGSTISILIVGMYALSQLILLDSYVQLEEQTVQRNVQRALNALEDQISVLHGPNVDWAHWNDTYQFIDDHNTEYVDANTYDGVFPLYGLNVMLFLNGQDELVFGKAYDLEAQQEIDVPESLLDIAYDTEGPLASLDASGEINTDGVAGLLMLPEGPMLIASTPILPTDLNGESRGRLVWGSYLNDMKLSELSEQTQLDLSLADLESSAADTADGTVTVQPLDQQTIVGSTVIKDILGQPAISLAVQQPRSIYNQGQNSLTYFLLSLLVLGIVFAVATILLLERVVLSRLAYLYERVTAIRTDRDLATRIELSGQDELSSLAAAMNSMLESLAQTQERLRLARDHALEASSAKAQILANVSHDARTPLSVIMLRAEMLKRGLYGPMTDKQNDTVDSILANSRQLLGFISNLLDGAQLESGKLQLHKRTFDVTALTISINEAFLPLANHKSVALNTIIEKDIPTQLYGDADRLTQVLFNLVGNAIKFTQKGSVTVRFYCYEPSRWAMEVSDTGMGISPEHQGRIFESFWQVDGTSTRMATSGVGLGLAIVKQLTTMMGGFVEVKSEVEKGSTFTVVLPIEQSQGEPDVAAEAGLNR